MADREKARESERKYRARNLEKRRTEDREYKARLRKEVPEKVQEMRRRYYERNKEKIKTQTYAYRAKHPERWREKNRRYQQERAKADPNYWRAKSIKKRYGITIEEFEQLLKAQENRCAICRTPADQIKRKCIDHCHRTGKVRGILCQGCNVAIAHLRDDPLIALRASEYLSRHNGECQIQILAK